MFDKLWFLKYQKLLLRFANSFIGRYILGLRTSSVKGKILQILPNSITWKEGKKFKTEFRTHDKFGKRLYYAFKPIWYLFHLWDFVWYPKLNLGFDSLTTYPSAGAVSPVDGYVTRYAVNVSWASLIGGTDGELTDTSESTSNMNYIQSTTTSNQYTQYAREVECFNTSSLSSSANISATVLSLYVTAQSNAFGGTLTHHIVSVSLASTDNIVGGDWDGFGTTSFANITNGSFNTPAYNDFNLDANGIANVNKTGVSQFGVRVNWDLTGSFGGTWTSSNTAYFTAYRADQTGTANDPKLVVTYTLPGGSYAYFM
jgi:hypothetical protein